MVSDARKAFDANKPSASLIRGIQNMEQRGTIKRMVAHPPNWKSLKT